MGKSSMQLFAEDFQQLQDKSGHNVPGISLLAVVARKMLICLQTLSNYLLTSSETVKGAPQPGTRKCLPSNDI